MGLYRGSGSEAGSAQGARLGWASMILLESSSQSTVCFGRDDSVSGGVDSEVTCVKAVRFLVNAVWTHS